MHVRRLCFRKSYRRRIYVFFLACSKIESQPLHVLAESGSDYLEVQRTGERFLSHPYLKKWYGLGPCPSASAQKKSNLGAKSLYGYRSWLLSLLKDYHE